MHSPKRVFHGRMGSAIDLCRCPNRIACFGVLDWLCFNVLFLRVRSCRKLTDRNLSGAKIDMRWVSVTGIQSTPYLAPLVPSGAAEVRLMPTTVPLLLRRRCGMLDLVCVSAAPDDAKWGV